MAKTKKRKSGSRRNIFGFTGKVPIAVVAGLVPGITFAFDSPEKSARQIMERILWSYTGIVSWETPLRWDSSGFRYGLFPLLGGYVLHALANAVGVNRLIKKIPLIEV